MDLQQQQKVGVLCCKYLFLTSFCYTESLDEDDSSDDEPLSKLAKKLPSQRRRKAPVRLSIRTTPVVKSKRNAARKKGRC